MPRKHFNIRNTFDLAMKRWDGSENDVSGLAMVIVVAQALWWRLVGVPVKDE